MYEHRIAPVQNADTQTEQIFAMAEQVMGFVPNSMRIMAHRPPLLQGFVQLMMAAYGPASSIDAELRQLVAFVSSLAAGCSYCQAHTSHGAERAGVNAEKIAALYDFENSDMFTDDEKAALSLAFAAGQVPNATQEEHFDRLREHYSEEAIVDIVAVIAMFGFLNRWNDTLATLLEEEPTQFAVKHLASAGWTGQRHGVG